MARHIDKIVFSWYYFLISEVPYRTSSGPEMTSNDAKLDDSYTYLGLEMEYLTDTFDLIHNSGINSYGFILTEPETHSWVMNELRGSMGQTEPDVISVENAEGFSGVIRHVIQKGRLAKQHAGTTILDLSSINKILIADCVGCASVKIRNFSAITRSFRLSRICSSIPC